jgi:hypothetical protein
MAWMEAATIGRVEPPRGRQKDQGLGYCPLRDGFQTTRLRKEH